MYPSRICYSRPWSTHALLGFDCMKYGLPLWSARTLPASFIARPRRISCSLPVHMHNYRSFLHPAASFPFAPSRSHHAWVSWNVHFSHFCYFTLPICITVGTDSIEHGIHVLVSSASGISFVFLVTQFSLPVKKAADTSQYKRCMIVPVCLDCFMNNVYTHSMFS